MAVISATVDVGSENGCGSDLDDMLAHPLRDGCAGTDQPLEAPELDASGSGDEVKESEPCALADGTGRAEVDGTDCMVLPVSSDVHPPVLKAGGTLNCGVGGGGGSCGGATTGAHPPRDCVGCDDAASVTGLTVVPSDHLDGEAAGKGESTGSDD